MPKYKYAVIMNDEDGQFIRFKTEEQLQEMLDEIAKGEWGYVKFVDFEEADDLNPSCWAMGNIMILKTECVIPKKVEVVTKYKL